MTLGGLLLLTVGGAAGVTPQSPGTAPLGTALPNTAQQTATSQAGTALHGGHADCNGSPYNCKLPNPDPPRGSGCGGVNRLKNPMTGACTFPLGAPAPLIDGLGSVIGTAAAQHVLVNYGQRKLIRVNGVTAPYAFALGVRLQEKNAAGNAYVVSGWLPLSGLTPQGDMPQAMTVVDTLTPPDSPLQRYTISGGTLQIRSRYGEYKVTPNAPLGPNTHQNVGDYLSRPTPDGQGVVNFLYSLPGSGGVATDTFPVGTGFLAVSRVPPVAVPMYDGHVRADRDMTFLYGRVADGAGHWRYGWIARWAVTP